MNIGRFTVAALALASLALPSAAQAQTTVFNTFGPGNSFGPGSYGVFGPGTGNSGSVGAAFSPSATGALSTISVAYNHGGIYSDAHLYLTDSFSKVGNTAASANLETFVFTAPDTPPGAIVVIPSTLHPILTAGQTYYLYGLEPFDELNSWIFGSNTAIGTKVLSINRAPYTANSNQQLPAFSIQVNAAPAAALVPESSGLANMRGALLALCLSGLVMAVKRQKAEKKKAKGSAQPSRVVAS